MNTIILICILLFVKHFIVDYVLQKAYKFKNKGIYGHIGGIQHALLHGFGTFVCLFYFTPIAFIYGCIDYVVHYHVDWFKTKYGTKYNGSFSFYIWLGADQIVHLITYIWIVYDLISIAG